MSQIPPRRGEQRRPIAGGPRRPAPTSSSSVQSSRADRSVPPRRGQAEDYDDEGALPARTRGGQRQGTRTRPDSVPYRSARTRYEEPPRRDSFPIIMGGVIGLLVVAMLVAVYLLLSRNSGPSQPAATTGAGSNSAAQTPAAASVQTPAGSGASDVPTAQSMSQSGTSSAGSPAQLTMVANRPANGLGTAMPDEGNAHVNDGDPITYKNYPPSSGTHYSTPLSAGFYDTTQQEGNFVHSLEHGYIVLYYKPDLPDATKQQLKDLMTKLPMSKYNKVKIVIVPYTNMKTPLAIAAWDRLFPLNDYNFDEIQTFYQQYVDRGPEDVP